LAASPRPAHVSARIAVFVITYRRPHLLERALRSLLRQTHVDWTAEVLNDDPADTRVDELVRGLADGRIRLFEPRRRRGAAENFNTAFAQAARAPFAAILEDDNWWEPAFLATMLAALEAHPRLELACGNERLWRELPDGSWEDLRRNIWAATEGTALFPLRAADKCGPAKLCNSSLFFRTALASNWLTPAGVPIDVTEHFRERAIPHPFLLVQSPLVNYGETLGTARSRDPVSWGLYQVLLIGSAFACLRPDLRPRLAALLWRRARREEPLAKSTLLWTGLAVPEARTLWREGRSAEKFRFAAGAFRRPSAWARLRRVRETQPDAWAFLRRGPVAEALGRGAAPDLAAFPATSFP